LSVNTLFIRFFEPFPKIYQHSHNFFNLRFSQVFSCSRSIENLTFFNLF